MASFMIQNKLKHILSNIFAYKEDFSLENRLFLSAMVIGTLMCIIGSIISFIISPSLVTVVICLLLSSITLTFYYFIRYKRIVEPFKMPIIIVAFIGISAIWVFDGGINGPDIMVSFVILMLALISVPHGYKKYIIIFFIVLLTTIYLIQFYRPDIIVNIPSAKNRWLDSIITAIYCSFFIFLIISFLHRHYTIERQKAEASEYKVRSMFENSLSGFIFLNAKGRILEANPAAINMLGSPSLEATKQINVLSFQPLIDIGFSNEISNCINEKRVINNEAIYTTKWEKKVYIKYCLIPIYHGNEITGVWANLEDLTNLWNTQADLQKAKEKAEESEKLYRLLAENSSDAVWLMDLDMKFIYVSPSIEKLLGYSSDERKDSSLQKIYDPDAIAKLKTIVIDHINEYNKTGTNEPQIFELEAIHKNRSKVWIEISAKLLIDENKEITGILGSSRNINERKNVEFALIKSKEKAEESEIKYHDLYTLIRLMSDSMPDMLWAKDLNNQYIFANKAMCDKLLCAINTSEPIGKTDIFFARRQRELNPDDPNWHTFGELCANTDTITLQHMKPMQFDEFGNVKGKFLFLDVHKTPLFNSESELIGVVGTARDVTLQKKVEQELIIAKEKAEESDKLKTAFLENISHEIRTPINAILGFSKLLLKLSLTGDKRNIFTDNLHQSTYQLLTSVENIITLAHIQTNQIQINEMEFNPDELLNKLFKNFNSKKHLREKSHINLILNKSELSTLVITSDYTRIEQIFNILLNNAFKFTNEGYIEFGYRFDVDKINYYVKDTGIGIPEDKQKVIFKSFTQADKNIRQLFGGLGIGLSIAKALVKSLSGKITINSQLNSGTEIVFSIPSRSSN